MKPASHLMDLCPTAEVCPFIASSPIEPLGRGYAGRIDKDTSITFNFGLRKESTWNPGFNYTAFVSLDQSRTASLASAAPTFASSIYYWVQGRALENYKAAIYGSPQVREWIYQDGEFVCPITVGLNFWQTDEGLTSDMGPVIPYSRIKIHCDDLRRRFESAMKESADAVANYASYVRNTPKDTFAKMIPQSFTTPDGVAYREALCAASSAEQRYTLSRDFIARMQDSAIVSLPELWVAYLIGHTKPTTGELTTPLDCAAP